MCNLLPKFLLVTLLLRPVLTGLLKARPMGQIKVVGPGHSVWSVSLEACVKLCDSSDQCDAINYHSSTHKCRLFTPCTHVYSTYGSPDYYFYSKRPQSKYLIDVGSKGYNMFRKHWDSVILHRPIFLGNSANNYN